MFTLTIVFLAHSHLNIVYNAPQKRFHLLFFFPFPVPKNKTCTLHEGRNTRVNTVLIIRLYDLFRRPK